MENSKKNPIKKIGKVALCGALLTGGVTAGLLSNTDNVSAISYKQFVIQNEDGTGVYSDVVNVNGNVIDSITLTSNKVKQWIMVGWSDGYYNEFEKFNSITIYDDNGEKFEAGTYDISFEADITYLSTYSSFAGVNLSNFDVTDTANANVKKYSTRITKNSDFDVTFGTKDSYGGVINSSGSLVSAGNHVSITFKNITIKKTDFVKPVINGSSVFYVNVDKKTPLSEILKNYTSVDETDGDVAINVVNDNYTGKEGVVGSYVVNLSSSDKSGNTAEMVLTIHVVDGTKPTISGQSEYVSNMSSPITEAVIRSKLTALDNYDKNLTIQLVNDGFTGNEQKLGTYKITYKVVDSSTNESELFEVNVTTKDDIKPVITGTSNFTASSSGAITIDYIKSQLSVNDNISSNLSIEILEDNYSNHTSIVGSYEIKFYVVDEAGNCSDFYVVTISVVDNIPPVFWSNNNAFNVDESLTLTHEQIVAVLIAQAGLNPADVTGFVPNEGMSYNVASINEVGVYSLSYRVQLNDGRVMDLEGNVNVIGEEDKVIEEIKPEEKVEQRVKNLWQKIGDFFKNLWNWIVKYLGFGWLWDKEEKYNPNW